MGLDSLAQDLRYAVRAIRKNPGFTAVAVFTLALGIGANTAIFSVVNAVLLNPLHYQNPEKLVVILHRGEDPVAAANFTDWREQAAAFESMGAAEYWTPNLTGLNEPEKLWALRMTSDVLPMLGVKPAIGRFFSSDEDAPGREHVVVISSRLWRRSFAGDPDVLKRSITLNGEAYNIVGVMPGDFKFAPFWATKAELWAPLALGTRAANRGGNSLRVFARLKPGVSIESAQAEMAAISGRLDQQHPGTNRDVRVVSLTDKVVGKVRPALLVLLGAVGFVLLIACANVAHMLLARAASRQKEVALRIALGAGRGRVVRQFLTESMLLAFAGGGAGLLLASAGIQLLVAISPANIPQVRTIAIEGRVLVFLLGASTAAGLLFGLVPALQASSVNIINALKEGGRGSGEGGSRNRLRGMLVASEFSLALMLLVGAGLMIRSFLALQSVDPGFNPHHVLSAVVSVAGSAEAAPSKRVDFYRQLVERIQNLPGVRSASAINHLPLAGDIWGWPFKVEGRPLPDPADTPIAVYRVVLPGYFATMNIPILSGRDISQDDRLNGPGVVVINQQMAAEYWPGEDPIGKRITVEGPGSDGSLSTVIGVVKNAKMNHWSEDPLSEMYLPYLQNHYYLENPASHVSYLTLVARTGGSAAALTAAVESAVWSLDKNLPVSEVQTMDQVVADSTAEPRFYLLMLGIFAAVALVLAAVGIYGVMSYWVLRRSHEIAIRIALGARSADVLRQTLKQGLGLAGIGLCAGLAGAVTLNQFMKSMLFKVESVDPLTYGLVTAVLLAVAGLACWIPAFRASRTDPMTALREE